jgi:hypothetical protein
VIVALQRLRPARFLGSDRSRAPMVADPMVRRAQSGYVAAPASLLALTVWQSGHGAMRGKLDVASTMSCFAVSAAQSFLAFTVSARPNKVRPTLGAEWERQDWTL